MHLVYCWNDHDHLLLHCHLVPFQEDAALVYNLQKFLSKNILTRVLKEKIKQSRWQEIVCTNTKPKVCNKKNVDNQLNKVGHPNTSIVLWILNSWVD